MTLEEQARAAMHGRGGGRCELCLSTEPVEASHRIARSRGGTWLPANVIALDHRCHDWCHTYPTRARAGGWHLETLDDPLTAPVWLNSASLWPGWFTLDERGDAHPTDHAPALLPPWATQLV